MVVGIMPAKDTPAFANPNTGTMSKATQGARACSRRWSGELRSSEAPGASFKGTHRASMTPATVACTPDSRTSPQRAAPAKR